MGGARIWCAAAVLAATLPLAARAQAPSPILPPADRAAIQEVLEHARTGVPRTLPSGGILTITATETSPRVCRDFRLESGARAVIGTGCRVGDRQWRVETRRGRIIPGAPAATGAVPLPPRRLGTGPAIAATPVDAPLPVAKPGRAPGPAFPLPPVKPAPG